MVLSCIGNFEQFQRIAIMLSLHILYMLLYTRFYCKISKFWWKQFVNLMKDKIELDKVFDEINMYVLLFNSWHVIHIPSFRIQPAVLWRPFY